MKHWRENVLLLKKIMNQRTSSCIIVHERRGNVLLLKKKRCELRDHDCITTYEHENWDRTCSITFFKKTVGNEP